MNEICIGMTKLIVRNDVKHSYGLAQATNDGEILSYFHMNCPIGRPCISMSPDSPFQSDTLITMFEHIPTNGYNPHRPFHLKGR